VSFDSEPGRDDGSLPPVDVVIPDDARELARDVLAYRREQRARRRRDRLLKLLGPLGRVRHAGVIPLVATCVALVVLGGAMLSIVTISPASAPTTQQPLSAPSTLPVSSVRLADGQTVATTSLAGSVVTLIPPDCDCGATLERLAQQARAARVRLYFVYDPNAEDAGLAQLAAQTAQYGDGVAQTVYDFGEVFFYAYTPYHLTALLVRRDATVDVVRTFRAGFDLTPALRGLQATH
jgi:hypothetical protein